MATYKRQTPPITAEGIFILRHPFEDKVKSGISYTVEAIRSFQELQVLNIDILQDYYLINGLTELDFKDDFENDVHLITLSAKVMFSDTNETYSSTIYVPDSYILTYPNGDTVNYVNYVLSVELGPLPEWFDASVLSGDIRELVKAMTGLYTDDSTNSKPEVKIFFVSKPESVSTQNSLVIEAARQANVTMTEPLSERLKEKNRVIDDLNSQIAALKTYIEENIIPPVVPEPPEGP